jgi:UDP-N-acetylmuramoyl-tripeptide--D-alanyl-D-alanine ligase
MPHAFVLTAGLIAEATGGRLVTGDAGQVIDLVSTDSRTLVDVLRRGEGAGALFIALRGERFDGHTFVDEAIARGAAAVLVSTMPAAPGDAAVICVDDTLDALQRLGHTIRRRSGATVVAITGSAGKTTTKEATAALLAPKFRVYRNPGNLNNHIGLPLSLIDLRHGPDVAVVELGMNHDGEIRALTAIAEPDVRVWTNVGNAHIGHFGSADGIARAKAELLETATSATRVVANADDARVMAHVRGCAGRVLTFGTAVTADVRAVHIDDRGFDGSVVDASTPWGSLTLKLALPGRANVSNVLAAAAVALDLGVSPAEVASAAAGLAPVARRGRVKRLPSGARVIDDSYNASPAAVMAMLETLRATPTTGRRIAVLGEMLELGEAAEALHAECGRAAAAAGLSVLVAVGGPAADGLVRGARDAGMPTDRIVRIQASADAAERVHALITPGDVVLIKGSRGTRTDVIADRVTEVA